MKPQWHPPSIFIEPNLLLWGNRLGSSYRWTPSATSRHRRLASALARRPAAVDWAAVHNGRGGGLFALTLVKVRLRVAGHLRHFFRKPEPIFPSRGDRWRNT